MRSADRLKLIPPYPFMELRKKIGQARAQGIDVISLAIGDPVEPTPQPVIQELARTAADPANHRYPTDEEKGMLAFRQAVASWYGTRYGVTLDPATEALGLIGSKEGCHHFVLARVNHGETVLMTDPGYPAYRASILIGGGEPVSIPIRPEHGYLPVLEDIPSDVARKATAMFVCYPNNPTGAVATPTFLRQLVDFARQYDVAICYDNPYIEIVFDGEKPLSFLSAPGAKDVGVELNSLSKPFNMTGWRIGMAVGNKDLIAAISQVKENTDSGVFNAIQYAGITALEHCGDEVGSMLGIYAKRRALVLDTLHRHRLQAGAWNLLPLGSGAQGHDQPGVYHAAVREGPRRGCGRHCLRPVRRGVRALLAHRPRRSLDRGDGANPQGDGEGLRAIRITPH
jgi:LL-diaminopimelate aminotransferase